jgi:tetratricopeptide (TPR) repeat protein
MWRKTRMKSWAGAVVLALAMGCSKPSADEHLKKAEAFLTESRLPEAILELRAAVQADPKRGDIRAKLADAYMQNRDLSAAAREYINAADLLPDDFKAQLNAGSILLLAQQFEDAKLRAQKAVQIDPKSADAQILLGNALAGLKDFDGALDEYQESLVLNPTQDLAYANIGAIQSHLGKIEEAEKTFRKAVDASPKSVKARLGLANFLFNIRPVEAEQVLKEALALDANDLTANRALGLYYVQTKRLPEAEPYFQTITRLANTPESKLGLADYYVLVKRYDDARKLLRDVAGTEKQYAVATVRLAVVDLMENNRAQAATKIHEVLEKYPKDGPARVMNIRLLLLDRKVEEALAAAQAMVNDDSNSTYAARAYAVIGDIQARRDLNEDAIKAYNEVIKREPASVEAQLALASVYVRLRDYNQASTFIKGVLGRDPKNPMARALEVRLLLSQGRSDKATEELKSLTKEFPNAPPVLNLIAAQHLSNRQLDAARETYLKVLKIAPNDLEASAGLIGVDMASGKGKDALARIETALKTSTPTPELLILAGQAYAASGDSKRAEEMLNKAIETDPSRMAAYGLLGQLYIREKRLDDAKDQFQQIITKNPASVGANTMLAMLLEMQGRTADAEKQYEKTLTVDSKAAVAANNLAWIYVSSGRSLDEALGLAQTALQKLPDEPNVNDTIGWIYFKKGLIPQAIQHLEIGVKNDPNDPSKHYRLGMAHIRNRDLEKARKELNQALASKTDFPESADARKALADINR